MEVELIGFEKEAAEDWQDSQILSIGQVHDIRSGCHRNFARKGLVSSQDWGRETVRLSGLSIWCRAASYLYQSCSAPTFRQCRRVTSVCPS